MIETNESLRVNIKADLLLGFVNLDETCQIMEQFGKECTKGGLLKEDIDNYLHNTALLYKKLDESASVESIITKKYAVEKELFPRTKKRNPAFKSRWLLTTMHNVICDVALGGENLKFREDNYRKILGDDDTKILLESAKAWFDKTQSYKITSGVQFDETDDIVIEPNVAEYVNTFNDLMLKYADARMFKYTKSKNIGTQCRFKPVNEQAEFEKKELEQRLEQILAKSTALQEKF